MVATSNMPNPNPNPNPNQVTVVATSNMVHEALKAARRLQRQGVRPNPSPDPDRLQRQGVRLAWG